MVKKAQRSECLLNRLLLFGRLRGPTRFRAGSEGSIGIMRDERSVTRTQACASHPARQNRLGIDHFAGALRRGACSESVQSRQTDDLAAAIFHDADIRLFLSSIGTYLNIDLAWRTAESIEPSR